MVGKNWESSHRWGRIRGLTRKGKGKKGVKGKNPKGKTTGKNWGSSKGPITRTTQERSPGRGKKGIRD